MSNVRFRVNTHGLHVSGGTFDWEEIPEFLGFVDARNVLNLEVGQKYEDFEGDEWERIA